MVRSRTSAPQAQNERNSFKRLCDFDSQLAGPREKGSGSEEYLQVALQKALTLSRAQKGNREEKSRALLKDVRDFQKWWGTRRTPQKQNTEA